MLNQYKEILEKEAIELHNKFEQLNGEFLLNYMECIKKVIYLFLIRKLNKYLEKKIVILQIKLYTLERLSEFINMVDEFILYDDMQYN